MMTDPLLLTGEQIMERYILPAAQFLFDREAQLFALHFPYQPDRRALPPDGPDIGCDVPGGGAI
jgi:hypothetical protein